MSRRYEEGNLARPLEYYVPAISYPMPGIEQPDKEKKDKSRKKNLEYIEFNRRAYYSAGKLRAKMARRLLMVFLAVVVAAVFITWRNAKIAEMSFYNTGLRRQIVEYEKENSLVYDQLASKTSLQAIEERALDALGMQKASSDAMVRLGDSNRVGGVFTALGSPMDDSEVIEQWVEER
ncbi:MAG: hypothetical protein GX910_04490 [Clostridiaceae bacterium]|jgi:hypothetical protein|nr:hypothetical protein [Clostridiaceae bacterium]